MTYERMPAVAAKARGLVRMRDLLCLDRWWTAQELANEMGIPLRTTERWLSEMELIGCMVTEEQTPGFGNVPRYRAEATYGRVLLR